LKLKFCKKNIITFDELFLKPSDTIRPESTRQFNIKILSCRHCPHQPSQQLGQQEALMKQKVHTFQDVGYISSRRQKKLQNSEREEINKTRYAVI